MHILDYITKAMNSRYWHTRVQFYIEFNGNVLTALREQGWNGKYMSAGDMSRSLTQETINRYEKIGTGYWGLTSYADRWLNNVKGIAKFNRALTEAGFKGGSFSVVKDSELAKQLGYRRNEYIFKLEGLTKH
mgnify:CR=1 FL=1